MKWMQTGLSVLAALLAGAAVAGDGTTVVVVSMEKLIKEHPDTKAAEDMVQTLIDDFEAEKKDMEKKFEAQRDKFDDARKAIDNPALTDTERADKKSVAEERLEELQKLELELKETMSRRKKEINEQTNRSRKRIIEKIQGAIGGYVKEKKIDLVLDKDMISVTGVIGVVVASEAADITADILPLLPETATAKE